MHGVPYYYNLYDGEELILESVQRKEILDFLGNDKINIAQYANLGITYGGRYKIEMVGREDDYDTRFAQEWNKAIKPFKRVEWVKSGGRKLTIGGGL